MNDRNQKAVDNAILNNNASATDGAVQPLAMARRTVLRRGAKLIYVVPAIAAAMRAVPASAVPVSRQLP